jgi:hypothetical protein
VTQARLASTATSQQAANFYYGNQVLLIFGHSGLEAAHAHSHTSTAKRHAGGAWLTGRSEAGLHAHLSVLEVAICSASLAKCTNKWFMICVFSF